jgi:hypothetical protein
MSLLELLLLKRRFQILLLIVCFVLNPQNLLFSVCITWLVFVECDHFIHQELEIEKKERKVRWRE